MRLLLTVFLTCVFVIRPFALADHPIYLSFTEIAYKAKQERLELSIKIFVDDLEDELSAFYKETIEIGTNKEHPKATEYIQDYLKKHFQLAADSKPIQLQWVGREIDKDDIFVLWVYLEANQLKAFSELRVENSILVNHLDRQLNFIAVHTPSGIKKQTTSQGKTSTKISWK